MWHGGAHHVGFDVHDVVEGSGLAVPGVVFCVDIVFTMKNGALGSVWKIIA